MNHTGSQIDYTKEEGIDELAPVLSPSKDGSGTEGDPYYQDFFEYTDNEQTTYKLPTSSELLTWYSNAYLGVKTSLGASSSDLGKISFYFS